jgi:hypothetical protein
MAVIAIAAIALLAKHLNATPVPHHPPHYPSNRPCTEFMLPVEATAHSAIYDVPQVNNNIEAMAYAVQRDTWSNQYQIL